MELHLKKYYIWSIVFYGGESIQIYLECFEMWCWTKMDR